MVIREGINGAFYFFQQTMRESSWETMDQGISNIAVTVDKSANAVSGVAEDATQLVNAISLIQEQTASNQVISRALRYK